MDTLLSFGPSSMILIIGVFLLLAAIVGGGLEIKEIKIPKIEKTPRILTAVLGMMLMMCGTCVGTISFYLTYTQPAMKASAHPAEIPDDYQPNTDYIKVDQIYLPQDTSVPGDVQKVIAELIVQADEAQILANYYQDESYLADYYSGDALLRTQQYVSEIKQSGYIQLDELDLNNSYYVDMRFDNNILSVDECEYWKTYFYDSSTGNLVGETDWMLVPQTINIELIEGQAYITAISFYQGQAFCAK